MRLHNITLPNLLRSATVGLMFLALSSATAQDQDDVIELPIENTSIFSYKGIEASIGTRNFTLKSDIPQLSNLPVMEEGGSAAFIFGNNKNRLVARVAGLYYSNANTARTIDLMEVELNSNLYLFKALNIPSKKMELYLLTGISNQSLKFYGKYIEKDDRAKKSSRAGQEPYLGKLNITNLNIGLGVEYKMEAEKDFVHFFIEAKTRFHLSSGADIDALSNTSVEDFYGFNAGIRFGRKK